MREVPPRQHHTCGVGRYSVAITERSGTCGRNWSARQCRAMRAAEQGEVIRATDAADFSSLRDEDPVAGLPRQPELAGIAGRVNAAVELDCLFDTNTWPVETSCPVRSQLGRFDQGRQLPHTPLECTFLRSPYHLVRMRTLIRTGAGTGGVNTRPSARDRPADPSGPTRHL